MDARGRKSAAGRWLLQRVLARVVFAMMGALGLMGFSLGLWVRGVPMVDRVAGELVAGSFIAVAMATVFLLFIVRKDSTWARGLAAERRVGDRIEHALVRDGCAFAHDVKEALGPGGNVDHVVLTPAGVWVVETKAAWLGKGRFQESAATGVGQCAAGSREIGDAVAGSRGTRDRGRHEALRIGFRLAGGADQGVSAGVVLAEGAGGMRRGCGRFAPGARSAGAEGVGSRFHSSSGGLTPSRLRRAAGIQCNRVHDDLDSSRAEALTAVLLRQEASPANQRVRLVGGPEASKMKQVSFIRIVVAAMLQVPAVAVQTTASAEPASDDARWAKTLERVSTAIVTLPVDHTRPFEDTPTCPRRRPVSSSMPIED